MQCERTNRTIEQDKLGNHVVLDNLGRRIYKTFMVVSQNFKCDKNCPFCTAKITLWPLAEDNWEKMDEQLQRCKDAGIAFEYLTISGNGEPSLYPKEVMRNWREIFDKHDNLFFYKRFQTGGNVFFDQEAHGLFSDYVFETTRVSLDDAVDMKVLRYKRNYTETENFRKSGVVLNHTLLNENRGSVVEDIKGYLQRFPNLYALNLKILNTNTFDESQLDNKYSRWILENGVLKRDAEEIAEQVAEIFPLTKGFNEFYDRVVFEGDTSDGRTIPITFYTRKMPYGLANVVFYQGRLVDYKLKEKELRGLENENRDE